MTWGQVDIKCVSQISNVISQLHLQLRIIAFSTKMAFFFVWNYCSSQVEKIVILNSISNVIPLKVENYTWYQLENHRILQRWRKRIFSNVPQLIIKLILYIGENIWYQVENYTWYQLDNHRNIKSWRKMFLMLIGSLW